MNHYGNHREKLEYAELYRAAPSIFATEPAETTSDQYQFIPTIQVVGDLQEAGWFPVQAGEQNIRNQARRGFQRHMIRFGHAGNDAVPAVGGTIIEMLLTTAHDGTAAFTFRGGVFRYVCANGLVVGSDLLEAVSVRHIGYQATQAIEAAHGMLANVGRLRENMAAMEARILRYEERHDFAADAARLRWKEEENTEGQAIPLPIRPNDLLFPRRVGDRKEDLWTTFNTVQENLIQRAGLPSRATTGRRMRTRPVKGIDQQVKLNSKLWDLAGTYLQAA